MNKWVAEAPCAAECCPNARIDIRESLQIALEPAQEILADLQILTLALDFRDI